MVHGAARVAGNTAGAGDNLAGRIAPLHPSSPDAMPRLAARPVNARRHPLLSPKRHAGRGRRSMMPDEERAARRLARKARGAGINARAYHHERLGWLCLVNTPWHEHPVALRDTLDIAYLAIELGLTTSAPQHCPATRGVAATRILDLHASGLTNTQIAEKVGCTTAWVAVVRARAAQEDSCAA